MLLLAIAINFANDFHLVPRVELCYNLMGLHGSLLNQASINFKLTSDRLGLYVGFIAGVFTVASTIR
jgi:hypothetical protein